MKKPKKKDMGHVWSESCCEHCVICGERKYYWEQTPKQFQKCPGPRKPEPKKVDPKDALIKRAYDLLALIVLKAPGYDWNSDPLHLTLMIGDFNREAENIMPGAAE